MGVGETIATPTTTPSTVRVWISGGTNGTIYTLSATALTALGRMVRRSAKLSLSNH